MRELGLIDVVPIPRTTWYSRGHAQNIKMSVRPIPVIDLFAGPGGLSEGFASFRTPSGERCFDIRLSIERDAAAHRTLELRSFVRSFQHGAPDAYYDFLTGH